MVSNLAVTVEEKNAKSDLDPGSNDFGARELERVASVLSIVKKAAKEISALNETKSKFIREALDRMGSEKGFASNGFGIVAIDSAMRILDANARFREIVELTSAKVVGTSVLDFCSAEDRTKIAVQILKVRDETVDECVEEVVLVSSEKKRVPAVVYVHRAEKREREMMFVWFKPSAISMDEHDRRSLRENAAKMFDDADVGIIVTDPKQDNNPIVFANKTFCKTIGYSAEQLVGKNPRVLRDQVGNSLETVENMRSAIRSEAPWSGLVRNRKKDCSYYYSYLWIRPKRDANGELDLWFGFSIDVTQQIDALERVEILALSASLDACIARDDLRGKEERMTDIGTGP